MPTFHALTIADVRRETEDTVSLAFDVPADLLEDYRFEHGQYLTLRAILSGEDTRRSYSICSGVNDDELRVAIKQVPGGLFSTYANQELKAGETLEVMTPMGRFTAPLQPAKAKHYVLFAAGSGITPMMSILKTVLTEEPESEVTLVYGNRKFQTVIFRDELEDLKDAYLGRLRIFHVLSREANEIALFSGRIDQEKCDAFMRLLIQPESVDHAFICGPEEMIEAVRTSLGNAGVPEDRVHFELFTSPKGKLGGRTEDQLEPEDTGVRTQTRVILYGQQWDFDMGQHEFVLDAASNQGLDLPYSCKGGMCNTCRAKLVKGEVEMEVNYALYPDEVEAGYILTCQSRPKTDHIEVDFDQQ